MNERSLAATAALLLLSAGAGAQDKPDKPEEKRRPTPVPVRLQVVFSRYQGDKKVASVPYTLAINANERTTHLRMGIEMPVRVESSKDGPASMQYKNVGNSVDCGADSLDETRFRVSCSIEQSSVYSAAGESPKISETMAGPPIFRTFKCDAAVILRDGQTLQYTAGTDPVSGEVLKVDLTLNVLK